MSKKPKKTEVALLQIVVDLLEGLQDQSAATNRHLEALNANIVKFNDNILKALDSLANYTGVVKEFPASLLSEEDIAKVDIIEKDDHWVVKPRKYLGRNTFGRISGAIREAGGEYVSKGKDSHFRIPKN